MPVRIIDTEELLVWKPEAGVSFTFRRVLPEELRAATRMYPQKDPNESEREAAARETLVAVEIFSFCLKEWEGMTKGAHDEPIPCETQYFARIPSNYFFELQKRMGGTGTDGDSPLAATEAEALPTSETS